MSLLLHVFSLASQLWLWFFDRFILYTLLKFVAPKLGVRFMNLGYWPSARQEDAKLKNFLREIEGVQEYEADKAHINLYEKALSMHPSYPEFEDLEILEVSCGQGYSLEWIENWHGPTRCMIGCDKIVTTNAKNIVYGDASDLPFADDCFDFILNVEAAHLYFNFPKFLNECSRVLKPGGVFCWLDIRYPHEIESVQTEAKNAGFDLKHFEQINDNVIEGLNHTSKKYDKILEKAPFFIKMFKKSLRATYCAPGTATYERLRSKQRVYIAAMWIKKIEG